MDELVSVIISVYNDKMYLQRAFDSVRGQSYRNLEVIVVDDCSTDGSGEFCDEYCKQDARFRVIHHEKNTGVSGPRNTGLKHAKGDYIYFLDSDDYIHVEAIEALVGAIKETGLELSAFDYVKTDLPNADIHSPRKRMPIESVPTKQMAFEMLSKVDRRWCVVWNKLYKRTLIDGLFFNDAYSIQDQDFNIRVYQKIDKAAYIPEQFCWYFNNPNSLQRNPSFRAKKFYWNTLNRFKMLDCIQPGKDEKKYRAWIIGYGFLQMAERRNIEKGTEYETDFRKLCKDILRNYGREFLFMGHFPLKKKLHFFSSWYFPNLYGIYAKIEED